MRRLSRASPTTSWSPDAYVLNRRIGRKRRAIACRLQAASHGSGASRARDQGRTPSADMLAIRDGVHRSNGALRNPQGRLQLRLGGGLWAIDRPRLLPDGAAMRVHQHIRLIPVFFFGRGSPKCS